ncbi:MAG TPA: response regulator [Azospirillaceae bacterium]|nr:response regulator [Azospirillaceae bacterium]
MARIVVIEDNEFTLASLRHALERLGHEVFMASNGRDGFDLYLKEKPDVVLTDIFMPERDGFETMRELKRHNPKVKVVCMSAGSGLSVSAGMARGNVLRYAEDFGADASIAKPFTSEQLDHVIKSVLGV